MRLCIVMGLRDAFAWFCLSDSLRPARLSLLNNDFILLNVNYSKSKCLSIVTDKWEQLSGRSILFSAVMDPFTQISSWMPPQVRTVKSEPGSNFLRGKCALTIRVLLKQSLDN